MANNRGLPSATSQKSIDGLHKEKKLSYQTLKDMEMVNDDYIKFAKKFGVTLDDVANVLSKSVENIVKTNKESENSIKEYEKNINDMKKKYRGINKHIADEYEAYAKTQIAELEKTSNELRETTRKNIIKESFKREKEEHSVKLLDSKYIKHDFKNLINNEYQSELEKLNISALETFGENFKTNSQYQTALVELEKEYTKKAIKESFKDESKRNEIKFMNNKFSKGNNLASTSNEYYNQLEKLKSDALDTYGEGFENNKEYKKALLNLNDEYAKNMKDAWKEDFKENHKVLGGIASGIKDTFERNKESLQGLLGPLNLFIAPLKDFFGGFGAVFKFIGGGVKKLFGKFTKKNPTASDVLKSGTFGVGALYIGNILQKQFGTIKGEGDSSSLKDKLLEPLEGMKEIFGKNSNFMKNARILSGMGGGLMVVADFISEFQKTGDWRSALSKGITGSSKLENAIKGAMLGFTIAGPAGLLVGALAGVALNYFSPEVEGFVKLMTGGISSKKQLFLESIKLEVKRGKNSQKALDIYTKLAESGMSDKDFVSLGVDPFESIAHNRVDWIRQYGKGNLSPLIDEEIKYMGNLFMEKGYDLSNALGMDKFKILLETLNKVSDDSELKSIMKNNKTLSKFINNILDTIKGSSLEGEELNKFLKERKISESTFDKMKNSTLFKNLNDDATIEVLKNTLSAIDPKNKPSIDDAIIRADGSIIKTNPKDTLVALKDIPLSMEQVRSDTTKNLNSSLNGLGNDKTLEKKLTAIIDVLSKILDKDIQVNLPPQTRGDLDIIMSGGMV